MRKAAKLNKNKVQTCVRYIFMGENFEAVQTFSLPVKMFFFITL
jgi:hypothetical protein